MALPPWLLQRLQNGGGFMPGAPPPWSTPPIMPSNGGYQPPPPPMRFPLSPMSGNRQFPRIASVMQQLGQMTNNVNPLAIGLLAAAGPRPQGTSSFGSRLGEAFQFASQANTQRSQQELVQRQLDELARQRRAGAALEGIIEQLSTGTADQPPVLTKQQASVLTTAAQNDPRAAMEMLAKVPGLLTPTSAPELSETGEKLRDVKDVLGRDLSEREALTLAGGGALFEVDEDEDEADKPLSATDLARVRQADGSAFPFGTTAAEAQAAGARVYTEAELKQERDVSSALNTLDTLEQMAVGDDGVFKDEGGSVLTANVLSRLGSGIANGLGALLGTDASVRRSVFSDTSLGAIGGLVRSMGEAGSLSDGDVARALALIPQLGATPDTEHEAKAKLSELRKIISRGVERSGAQNAGAAEFDFDPATGQLIARQ